MKSPLAPLCKGGVGQTLIKPSAERSILKSLISGWKLILGVNEMGVETVREYLKGNGLDYDILEFDVSTETVDLAARALGVEPALIAKTLGLKLKDRSILVVTKGDARLDNKKLKQHFQSRAKMMSPEEVKEKTGHPVGGVCPFGLKQKMDIFLDASLRRFDKVYPAAGSKNSCIEIAPDDLMKITDAQWVDVCK
jgi:Cys-tRNA(Pro) deacylase